MSAPSQFKELYDDHEEYKSRRDPSSFNAKSIMQESREYKVPNLLSVLPAGSTISTVVEIGSGTGEVLASFPDVCPSTRLPIKKTGFDISPLNVAAARDRYPHITFFDTDFRASGVTADLVILSDILEHVPDDVGFLAAASEVAPKLLINLPLEDNWLNRNRNYGIEDSSGHLRAYSLDDGLSLIAAAGLDVVEWSQVWAHETQYDLNRRRLRRDETGYSQSGSIGVRVLKSVVYSVARGVRPFGRRLFPSNLFACARK